MYRNSALRHAESSDLHTVRTVPALVATHADLCPDRPALITADGEYSWDGLLGLTRGWAVALSAPVSGRSNPVAVVVDGSRRTIALAVAVTMSGRTLVALDPTSPPARHQTMIDTSAAELITTDLAFVDGPLPHVDPSTTAVILFTSGSTGTPKAVPFTHEAALEKAGVVARELDLSHHDRIASALPFGFGAGLTTFLAALTVGAPTLYWDSRKSGLNDLPGWLVTHGATTLHGSASMLRGLSSSLQRTDVPRSRLDDLRLVVGYGEALDGSDVASIRTAISTEASIVTWYATTEIGAVAWRSVAPGEAIASGPMHSGRVVAGRSVSIVDEDGTPLRAGKVGEICVRGATIPPRYLSGATTRMYRDDSGTVVYRTGDRGWFDADANLHLTGRMDDVVKIRGYLVDPGEVTAALRAIPGVADAVVLPAESAQIELRAYVASSLNDTDLQTVVAMPDDAAIRSDLRARLPEWMVPREIVRLPRLPRTERGKIDRAALPVPAVSAGTAPAGSMNLTETAVTQILHEVMGSASADLSTTDDLLALGLDSLMLVSVLAQVKSRFHVSISPEHMLRTPTIQALAELISVRTREGVRDRSTDPILVPLQVRDSSQSVFIIAGAGAPAVSLMGLCRHIDTDQSVYGLQAKGLESRGRPDKTITATATRFISRMRTVAPHGPYTLVGHSMGGIVAQEISVQLIAAGEQVRQIVVIDSRLTERMLRDLPGEPVPDCGAAPAESAANGLRLSARTVLKIWLQIQVAGLWQFDPMTQWMIFYNKGLRAVRRHRMRKTHAPITVLRTADNSQTIAAWARTTSGPVDVIDVSGEHATLLREPWVRDVAQHCKPVI